MKSNQSLLQINSLYYHKRLKLTFHRLEGIWFKSVCNVVPPRTLKAACQTINHNATCDRREVEGNVMQTVP